MFLFSFSLYNYISSRWAPHFDSHTLVYSYLEMNLYQGTEKNPFTLIFVYNDSDATTPSLLLLSYPFSFFFLFSGTFSFSHLHNSQGCLINTQINASQVFLNFSKNQEPANFLFHFFSPFPVIITSWDLIEFVHSIYSRRKINRYNKHYFLQGDPKYMSKLFSPHWSRQCFSLW